jgi:hypothetical protein
MDINDVVALKNDYPEEGLKKGARGVIVAIFDHPELAYEVEFCDDEGNTKTEVLLKPCLITLVKF